MESSVRMAAATVLAILGEYRGDCADDDASRVSILQNRMTDAVHAFVGDHHLSFSCQSTDCTQSHDMTRRRIRLLSCLATPENEDYLATLLYSGELQHRRTLHSLTANVQRLQQTIEDSHNREKQLLLVKESCFEKLSAQAIAFQRQKCEFQRSTTQNAKALVQVHQAERSKVELRSQELADRLRDTEQRLAEASRAAEVSHRVELESKAALDDAEAKVAELASHEQEAVRREHECRRKLGQVAEDLRSTTSRMEQMKRNEEKMMAQIAVQKESLANMDDSNLAMRDSLESLFADMVSLALLFEKKEGEEKAFRENAQVSVQRLKQELEAERARSAELEDKFIQTECQNDMLSRKYERTREKLEREREDRQKDAVERLRRAGPVSYINQLHQSNASEKHFKDVSGSSRSRENDSNSSNTAAFRNSRKKCNR